ncbi:MAG: hypothetical protein ACTTH6_01865 [Candidatus Altimarinota bacterium]
MKGKFSNFHQKIYIVGYKVLYTEYKTTKIRDFCEKYKISHHTAKKIFGPKMTKSKKRMVEILKKEGEQGKVREIAERNIL